MNFLKYIQITREKAKGQLVELIGATAFAQRKQKACYHQKLKTWEMNKSTQNLCHRTNFRTSSGISGQHPNSVLHRPGTDRRNFALCQQCKT